MGQPIVLAEAFLSLTHQVQALIGMMQTIIPLIPQLAQLTLSLQLPLPVTPPTLSHDRPMTLSGERLPTK